jgi:hypothetical protein
MPAKNPTNPQPGAPSTVAECPARDSSVRDNLPEWLKLPAVSGLQCVQALRRAGFAILQNLGGYVELRLEERMVEVPVPLAKQLGFDVLVAILKRTGIGPRSFVALLDEEGDSPPPSR